MSAFQDFWWEFAYRNWCRFVVWLGWSRQTWTGVIVALISIAITLSSTIAYAQYEKQKRIDSRFDWVINDSDDTPLPEQWVRLTFKDGRIVALRLTSIQSTEYYPAAIAEVFGMTGDTLKVNYAGGSLRLAVEGESGKAFVKRAFDIID